MNSLLRIGSFVAAGLGLAATSADAVLIAADRRVSSTQQDSQFDALSVPQRAPAGAASAWPAASPVRLALTTDTSVPVPDGNPDALPSGWVRIATAVNSPGYVGTGTPRPYRFVSPDWSGAGLSWRSPAAWVSQLDSSDPDDDYSRYEDYFFGYHHYYGYYDCENDDYHEVDVFIDYWNPENSYKHIDYYEDGEWTGSSHRTWEHPFGTFGESSTALTITADGFYGFFARYTDDLDPSRNSYWWQKSDLPANAGYDDGFLSYRSFYGALRNRSPYNDDSRTQVQFARAFYDFYRWPANNSDIPEIMVLNTESRYEVDTLPVEPGFTPVLGDLSDLPIELYGGTGEAANPGAAGGRPIGGDVVGNLRLDQAWGYSKLGAGSYDWGQRAGNFSGNDSFNMNWGLLVQTGANQFSANRAFVQWAGFTAGITESFYDYYDVPATSYNGIYPASDTGDPGWTVFGYTAELGNSLSATITANSASSGMPTGDYSSNIRLDQTWGRAQVNINPDHPDTGASGTTTQPERFIKLFRNVTSGLPVNGGIKPMGDGGSGDDPIGCLTQKGACSFTVPNAQRADYNFGTPGSYFDLLVRYEFPNSWMLPVRDGVPTAGRQQIKLPSDAQLQITRFSFDGMTYIRYTAETTTFIRPNEWQTWPGINLTEALPDNAFIKQPAPNPDDTTQFAAGIELPEATIHIASKPRSRP